MYYPIQDAIKAQGYECFVNNLPSASRNPPEEPATLEDDAVFIRGVIEKIADQGKDIVVIAHSYGGVVATEAAKGVVKADRQANGKRGGIVKIAYLSAIVLPVGGSNFKNQGDPPAALVEVGKVSVQNLSLDRLKSPLPPLFHPPISLLFRMCMYEHEK